MSNPRMRLVTGTFALASVALWLPIFPLYMAGDPSVSLYDGAGIANDFFRIRNFVFTRILLGLALYVTLLVFAVGLRELIRRANADYEWIGTLILAAMVVWLSVTLVANGLEGGIALDTLNNNADPSVARSLTMGYLLIYNGSIAFVMTAVFLAAAGYATLATGFLPRWTGWLACTERRCALYAYRRCTSGARTPEVSTMQADGVPPSLPISPHCFGSSSSGCC